MTNTKKGRTKKKGKTRSKKQGHKTLLSAMLKEGNKDREKEEEQN